MTDSVPHLLVLLFGDNHLVFDCSDVRIWKTCHTLDTTLRTWVVGAVNNMEVLRDQQSSGVRAEGLVTLGVVCRHQPGAVSSVVYIIVVCHCVSPFVFWTMPIYGSGISKIPPTKIAQKLN